MEKNSNNNIACALRAIANQVEMLDTFEDAEGVIRINTIEEWLDLFMMGYSTTTDVATCFGKEIKFSGPVGKLVDLILALLASTKPKSDVNTVAKIDA